MAFSEDDKERVRDATSIVDLIGSVTTVKKTGRNYMAICPFHQEKTPSMSIDPARGLYYCHGCHQSGDIFTFVQETEGLTFPEALESLAGRAGITLTEDQAATRRRGERRRLVDAVRAAVDFYHRRLMTAEEAGPARSYLRGRGYDADVVAEFKLGYAPGGDALVRELRAGGLDDKTMMAAGLARRGRSGMYDEFRDRVLFPITDVRGDPVGFGGRTLTGDGPKYLNTPETSLYKKSRLLYGLDRARRHISRTGYAVVVEGYTDVIALHRADLPVAVATCGTALGEEHFDLLRRFTDRIVLAFDADAAGAGAALRGDTLETPVRLDLDLRVADMPAGVDPADMVQQGEIEELRRAVEDARPLLQFRIERELAAFDLTEPESRARALRAVAPRVAAVSDEIVRHEYGRFVADRLGVELSVVEAAVGRPSRRGSRPSRPATELRPPDDARVRLERELLRSVLADGGGAVAAGVDESLFRDERLGAVFGVIQPRLDGLEAGAPVPLPPVEEEFGSTLVELAMDERPVASPGELVRRIRMSDIDEQISELRDRLTRLDPSDQEYSNAFETLLALQQAKRDKEPSDPTA
jgi:DNA primase